MAFNGFELMTMDTPMHSTVTLKNVKTLFLGHGIQWVMYFNNYKPCADNADDFVIDRI